MSRRRVLVVDDEPACLEFTCAAISRAGHEVRTAADGILALLALEQARPDVVLTDLHMPRMDGLELLNHIRQRWPRLPVILLTVEEDLGTVVRAVQAGASNYLIKPAAPASLAEAVERACGPAECDAAADDRVSGLVGVSPGIVEARHRIALACRSEVNVLVTGATGTGKELVARAIHSCSPRREGPFIAHNCASTVLDLAESQFFGHGRGAFTGADRDQVGLIEQANRGVLFLDEVDSLAPSLQAKLLRVLDDGEVRPVGASTSRHVSVRFVAALNGDPEALRRNGTLREDFYFRLRGFEIRLEPLDDRPEDVPVLAAHFAAELESDLSPSSLRALEARAWPGNVRELRNCIRAAAGLAGKGRIEVHHLPGPPGEPDRSRPKVPDACEVLPLRALERRAIAEALREHGGNRSHAAAALGIDRSTLRRKMQEYGIREG